MDLRRHGGTLPGVPDLTVINGPWKQQCTATARHSGQRCRRWAAPGLNVCRNHGGGGKIKHPDDPAAKSHPATMGRQRLERIRERIQEMGDLAADTLAAVMQDLDAEPKDKLKAAEMVLDRLVGRKIEAEASPEERQDTVNEVMQLIREKKAAS